MTEDERQPCLNEAKGEIAVDDNESEVKENCSTDVRCQLLSENVESEEDKNVVDLENSEIVDSVSKISEVSLDETVDSGDVITVNEDESKKDVGIETGVDSESNVVGEELKETSDDSGVDNAEEGKVRMFLYVSVGKKYY